MGEINALLELQCDSKITAGLDEEGVLDYMQAILSVMKQTYPTHNAEETYSFAVAKDSPQLRQRFEVLLRRNRRRSKRARILLNCGFLALFILSYMVIVQPYYPPPDVEVYDTVKVTKENSFILHSGSQYFLYYNDVFLMEITETDLKEVPYNNLEIVEGLQK